MRHFNSVYSVIYSVNIFSYKKNCFESFVQYNKPSQISRRQYIILQFANIYSNNLESLREIKEFPNTYLKIYIKLNLT